MASPKDKKLRTRTVEVWHPCSFRDSLLIAPFWGSSRTRPGSTKKTCWSVKLSTVVADSHYNSSLIPPAEMQTSIH